MVAQLAGQPQPHAATERSSPCAGPYPANGSSQPAPWSAIVQTMRSAGPEAEADRAACRCRTALEGHLVDGEQEVLDGRGASADGRQLGGDGMPQADEVADLVGPEAGGVASSGSGGTGAERR